jgi:hypothetical protein
LTMKMWALGSHDGDATGFPMSSTITARSSCQSATAAKSLQALFLCAVRAEFCAAIGAALCS